MKIYVPRRYRALLPLPFNSHAPRHRRHAAICFTLHLLSSTRRKSFISLPLSSQADFERIILRRDERDDEESDISFR